MYSGIGHYVHNCIVHYYNNMLCVRQSQTKHEILKYDFFIFFILLFIILFSFGTLSKRMYWLFLTTSRKIRPRIRHGPFSTQRSVLYLFVYSCLVYYTIIVQYYNKSYTRGHLHNIFECT